MTMQIKPGLSEQTPAGSAVSNKRTSDARAPGGASFRQAWSAALANGSDSAARTVTVKRGDTLIGITRRYLGESASQMSGAQLHDMARALARDNGIRNPDRIMPGQSVNLPPLATLAALNLRQPSVERVQLNGDTAAIATPVLDKTLERAVARGYLQAGEQSAVRDKILALSNRHRFAPDDFAHMTLMESDGMNPRASNGSCHGIIQFCDGPNRGAASAGFAKNPKAILDLSVLQQLDLVDSYFEETRLKDYGPASLDNLYLTVLTPAARSQTGADVPLNISGRQAASLYAGREQSGAITRNSILAGLKQNARDRLSEFGASLAKAEN